MERQEACYAHTDKGCMALTYSVEELTPELCANCKWYKTVAQREKDLNAKPSKVKGFYLFFDGWNKGFFSNIKAIDKWLKEYWRTHEKIEIKPEDCLFDDYNVLFLTHTIKFKIGLED